MLDLTANLVYKPLNDLLKREIRMDPAYVLSSDIMTHEIFKRVSPEDRINCLNVNKRWAELAEKTIRQLAKEMWEKWGIPVSNPPPLPQGIYKWLKTTCHFWKGNFLSKGLSHENTGAFFLMPQGITIKLLGKIMRDTFGMGQRGCYLRNRKLEENDGYTWLDEDIETAIGDEPVKEHYWIWITYQFVPGSRGRMNLKRPLYEIQKTLIERPVKNGQPIYQLVEKAIEVVALLLTHFASTGVCLLNRYRGRFEVISLNTYCQEAVTLSNGKCLRVYVGDFCPKGLCVSLHGQDYCYALHGMGALASHKF